MSRERSPDMSRDEDSSEDEEPTVVDLTAREEVDWLAAGRRERICQYEPGTVVETPDGEGTIGARFVHEQSIGGREIVASRESPTYVVERPESEPPHPFYDEAELTKPER
jgi:hypothetical protein